MRGEGLSEGASGWPCCYRDGRHVRGAQAEAELSSAGRFRKDLHHCEDGRCPPQTCGASREQAQPRLPAAGHGLRHRGGAGRLPPGAQRSKRTSTVCQGRAETDKPSPSAPRCLHLVRAVAAEQRWSLLAPNVLGTVRCLRSLCPAGRRPESPGRERGNHSRPSLQPPSPPYGEVQKGSKKPVNICGPL